MGSVVTEPGLHRDSQTLGDSVDVVEVGDHLGGAGDAGVVEPGGAKPGDVIGVDGGRGAGEFLGVLTECDVDRVEPSGPPVDGDPVYLPLVVDLVPEVVQMGRDSVVAVVHL